MMGANVKTSVCDDKGRRAGSKPLVNSGLWVTYEWTDERQQKWWISRKAYGNSDYGVCSRKGNAVNSNFGRCDREERAIRHNSPSYSSRTTQSRKRTATRTANACCGSRDLRTPETSASDCTKDHRCRVQQTKQLAERSKPSQSRRSEAEESESASGGEVRSRRIRRVEHLGAVRCARDTGDSAVSDNQENTLTGFVQDPWQPAKVNRHWTFHESDDVLAPDGTTDNKVSNDEAVVIISDTSDEDSEPSVGRPTYGRGRWNSETAVIGSSPGGDTSGHRAGLTLHAGHSELREGAVKSRKLIPEVSSTSPAKKRRMMTDDGRMESAEGTPDVVTTPRDGRDAIRRGKDGRNQKDTPSKRRPLLGDAEHSIVSQVQFTNRTPRKEDSSGSESDIIKVNEQAKVGVRARESFRNTEEREQTSRNEANQTSSGKLHGWIERKTDTSNDLRVRLKTDVEMQNEKTKSNIPSEISIPKVKKKNRKEGKSMTEKETTRKKKKEMPEIICSESEPKKKDKKISENICDSERDTMRKKRRTISDIDCDSESQTKTKKAEKMSTIVCDSESETCEEKDKNISVIVSDSESETKRKKNKTLSSIVPDSVSDTKKMKDKKMSLIICDSERETKKKDEKMSLIICDSESETKKKKYKEKSVIVCDSERETKSKKKKAIICDSESQTKIKKVEKMSTVVYDLESKTVRRKDQKMSLIVSDSENETKRKKDKKMLAILYDSESGIKVKKPEAISTINCDSDTERKRKKKKKHVRDSPANTEEKVKAEETNTNCRTDELGRHKNCKKTKTGHERNSGAEDESRHGLDDELRQMPSSDLHRTGVSGKHEGVEKKEKKNKKNRDKNKEAITSTGDLLEQSSSRRSSQHNEGVTSRPPNADYVSSLKIDEIDKKKNHKKKSYRTTTDKSGKEKTRVETPVITISDDEHDEVSDEEHRDAAVDKLPGRKSADVVDDDESSEHACRESGDGEGPTVVVNLDSESDLEDTAEETLESGSPTVTPGGRLSTPGDSTGDTHSGGVRKRGRNARIEPSTDRKPNRKVHDVTDETASTEECSLDDEREYGINANDGEVGVATGCAWTPAVRKTSDVTDTGVRRNQRPEAECCDNSVINEDIVTKLSFAAPRTSSRTAVLPVKCSSSITVTSLSNHETDGQGNDSVACIPQVYLLEPNRTGGRVTDERSRKSHVNVMTESDPYPGSGASPGCEVSPTNHVGTPTVVFEENGEENRDGDPAPQSGRQSGLVRLANGMLVSGYLCTDCNKLYANEKQLYSHRRRIHGVPIPLAIILEMNDSSEKPVEDNIQFQVQNLEKKKRSKRYKCSLCRRACWYPYSLKLHMYTHTGERPFKCEECGQSFSEKGTLKRHIRCHTGEKPYKCTVCDMKFSVLETLKSHLYSHTGKSPCCSICGKTFSRPDVLTKHVKSVHQGEKPFLCTSCGGGFTTAPTLKKHIKICLASARP